MKAVLYSLLIFFFILSCKSKVQEAPPDLSHERMKRKEALIKLNKYVARRNQDLIYRFIERTGWNMKSTGTGLWYEIIIPGKGRPVSENSTVNFCYNILLLDGTFCDSVSSDNPKIMKVGRGGVESGLEEALLLLKEGDHARFIIPPHLAHGNFGDGDKIPPGATIIYELTLLKVDK